MEFPEGRRFAFTILDDTDVGTLENVKPVYDRLREYGFRTTKTVWPVDCPEGSLNYFAADTLQRADYLAYVKELVADGFELASHGATMESSDRERTEAAIAFLESEFGGFPRLYANHGENRENLYWGPKRFRTAALRWLLTRLRRRSGDYYCGESAASPYFWGDLCRERVEYVRNFTFRELNALRVNPEMPYRRADTPFVKHWFSTADAPDVETFRERITPQSLERLEAQGGVCIVSTHLGKGFATGGRLDPTVDATLRHLAARPGWFVPVSEILDHLVAHGAGRSLGALGVLRLDLRFLADQVLQRASMALR